MNKFLLVVTLALSYLLYDSRDQILPKYGIGDSFTACLKRNAGAVAGISDSSVKHSCAVRHATIFDGFDRVAVSGTLGPDGWMMIENASANRIVTSIAVNVVSNQEVHKEEFSIRLPKENLWIEPGTTGRTQLFLGQNAPKLYRNKDGFSYIWNFEYVMGPRLDIR